MNIAQWIILALLALPMVEIYILIQLIAAVGFVLSLAVLLGAAAFGAFLLRTQGWSNWVRVQKALAEGELPAEQMIESSLIAVAGLLLVIPGLVSDVLALFCLIPAIRKALARYILRNRIVLHPHGGKSKAASRTIEGEYRRED